MPQPTLAELQEASKEIHSALPSKRKRERRKIKKFNPACYLHIDPFIEILKKVTNLIEVKESPKIDFTQIEAFKKKPKVIQKSIVRIFKEEPAVPDEKKVIVRPPAVYSNSSPYGIADEVLRGK